MSNQRSYPETTLMLNVSVDGRITSHDSDLLDPDTTWKQTPGIRGVLQQFYEFNQSNMVALTTGILMKNMGVNTRKGQPKKEDISLVVLDPDADLTFQGIDYLRANVKKLYLVCLHHHPIVKQLSVTPQPNLTLLRYQIEIDLNDVFKKLYQTHHIKKLFIQSIAPLNASLIDAGLIDHLSVIISPLLVGDHGVPALPHSSAINVTTLQLVEVTSLARNFVNLRYDILQDNPVR